MAHYTIQWLNCVVHFLNMKINWNWLRKVTHSFEVHSNESACRKSGRLGQEQVIVITFAVLQKNLSVSLFTLKLEKLALCNRVVWLNSFKKLSLYSTWYSRRNFSFMWKKFEIYSILKKSFWSEKAVRSTRLCTKRCFFLQSRGGRFLNLNHFLYTQYCLLLISFIPCPLHGAYGTLQSH